MNQYRIENNRHFAGKHWYRKTAPWAFRVKMRLVGDNAKKLTDLYGKHIKRHRGHGEGWLYEWVVPFEDKTFHVFSGKKGTSFEIEYEGDMDKFNDDWRTGKIIARFIESMKILLDCYEVSEAEKEAGCGA